MGLGDDTPGSRVAPAHLGRRADLSFTGFGPFRLYPAERRLDRDGETVPLGGRALDILILLVGNAGKVVAKQDLMQRVWQGTVVDESSLRTHIAALRKALGDGTDGVRYVVNVAGQGYCFVHPLNNPERPQPSSSGRPGCERGSPLPRRLTPIVDREDDRSTVAELLRDHRFVTIHGSGGIGKTTVALAVANELRDTFQGQVCFLDLGLLGIKDPSPTRWHRPWAWPSAAATRPRTSSLTCASATCFSCSTAAST